MMRWLLTATALTLVACTGDPPPPPLPPITPPAGSELYGVFEGRTPCEGCDRVKLWLVLHRSAQDRSPTAYMLGRIYVGQGNDRHLTEGRWTSITGTPSDPAAVLYRLDDAAPGEYARYLAIGPNILLLLDQNLEPRVGDASHSFALSRTQ
jgi:hypothetical protein